MEEKKEATILFNDKKIPMSQLSFQTQRNMQRLSQLQNTIPQLQEQLAEAQVLLQDYSSKVNAALEEAASRQDDQVVETSEGKPWEGKEALQEIHTHERECALRYERIEERLADGSRRFDRIERMLWGVIILIIGSLLVPQFLGA